VVAWRKQTDFKFQAQLSNKLVCRVSKAALFAKKRKIQRYILALYLNFICILRILPILDFLQAALDPSDSTREDASFIILLEVQEVAGK